MQSFGLLLPLTLLLSLSCAAEPQWPDAPPANTAELVETHAHALLSARVVSALAVAVVHGDQTERFFYGQLSEQDQRTPDASTLFEIGSITKTFTAALLAQSVAAGEVTLETPVAELLPPALVMPQYEATPIRLGDLASHLSGLPRLPKNLNILRQPEDPYASYHMEDLAKFLKAHKLRRAPGTQYEYSNLGFAILGLALAHAKQQDFAVLLRERLFAPLALGDVYLDGLTPELAARIAPPHALSKLGPVPGHRWNLGLFAPAGGIVASLDAMVNYLRTNMHPQGTALADAAALLYTPRFTIAPGSQVALGWHRLHSEETGCTVIWHNGETGGYSSFIGFMPDRDAGLVLLCNTAASKHTDEAAFRMLVGLDALAL